MSDSNKYFSSDEQQTQKSQTAPDDNNTVTADNNTTNEQEETIEQGDSPGATAIEEAPKGPSFSGELMPERKLDGNVMPPTPPFVTSDPATDAAISPMLPKKSTAAPKKPAEPGYGPSFPEKLFERLQLKVEMPAGGVRLRFQLTKSLIISHIPDGSQAIGSLESGDWIRSIDGTNVETRRKAYSLLRHKTKNEAYSIIFNVKRPLRNVFLTNEKQFNEYLPPAIEILPGYSYLLAFLATFPGAKVGLHVKSYENRVYVSSISHGSISELVFHVGDVILSVDDVAIASVSDAHKRIQEALKSKRWVQTVVERAESKIALQRMNNALKADRKLDIDPKMAEDINVIVENEMKRMKECNNSKDFGRGILRRENKQSREVTLSQTSKETPIQCDPVNLKLLVKVPANRTLLSQKKKFFSRRLKGPGQQQQQGLIKHAKTPNGISYTEFIPQQQQQPSSSSTTQSSSSASRSSASTTMNVNNKK